MQTKHTSQQDDALFNGMMSACSCIETKILERIFNQCVMSESTRNELVTIAQTFDKVAKKNRKAAQSTLMRRVQS